MGLSFTLDALSTVVAAAAPLDGEEAMLRSWDCLD